MEIRCWLFELEREGVAGCIVIACAVRAIIMASLDAIFYSCLLIIAAICTTTPFRCAENIIRDRRILSCRSGINIAEERIYKTRCVQWAAITVGQAITQMERQLSSIVV